MDLRKSSFAALLISFLLIFNFSVVAQTDTAPEATPAAAAAGGGLSDGAKAGEKLFKANCASCHKVDKKMIGPALKGAEKRWADNGAYNGIDGRTWLNNWVRNSQDVIKQGHPYGNKLFNDYNKSIMTAFPQLKDEDVANIMAYVETYVPPVPPGGGDDGGVVVEPSPWPKYVLYALIVILLLAALGLGSYIGKLGVKILEKQGLPIPAPVPIYKEKKLIVTIALVVVIFIGYAAVNQAIDLGRQQGYAPEQPIKFPHKLHAEVNKINCQYCHSSASKGKHANIPSMNVCMNCHKGVMAGDVNGVTGRKEIAKIYASVGFNPNTIQYMTDEVKNNKAETDKIFTEWLQGDEKVKPTSADIAEVLQFVNKPVEWVRIHNLPDHVYFNHSQHVTVGGIECQTCHGPVEQMDVVYQFAPLSMGWCVNCHRTTDVNFAGNKFYDDYQQLHEDLKSGKRNKITVETIGGTECQKCHY